MVKNCSKVKNQCKICLDSVTTKTGLQCQGACKRWVHFDCLNFTPGKIQDIKNGVIQINCPCPTCNVDVPKEFLTDPPYTCKNKTCPATQPPRCEEPKCPSNEPVPGLLAAQLAEKPSSATILNDSSSQTDTEKTVCCGAHKKSDPTSVNKHCCKICGLTEKKRDKFEQKSSSENKLCKPEICALPEKKPDRSDKKSRSVDKPCKPATCVVPEKKSVKIDQKSSPDNKSGKPKVCGVPEKKSVKIEKKPSRENESFKPETLTSPVKKSAVTEQKSSTSSPDLCCATARKHCCRAEPDIKKAEEDANPENEKLKKKTLSDSQLSLSKLNNKALLSVCQNLCSTIGELSQQVQNLLSKIGDKGKPKPDK
ncbi:hypothetical protein evm_012905 [Chilo suppressalis]|nr:hypothetical protein evm_012905 [Chilo suppressalis]